MAGGGGAASRAFAPPERSIRSFGESDEQSRGPIRRSREGTGGGDERLGLPGDVAQADLAARPALGFGASDCHCPSHLIHLPTLPDRSPFEQWLGATIDEVILDD